MSSFISHLLDFILAKTSFHFNTQFKFFAVFLATKNLAEKRGFCFIVYL